MNDRAKTNSQTIKEISVLKQRIRELEQAESKREEIDQAFRQCEGKYRSLIESIQDGVYILDSFGTFTFVNDVIVKRSGFPAEWFLGRSYLSVIIKEDHERVQRHFNAVMDGKTQIYNLSYPAKSGSLIHVEVRTAPLFDNVKVIGLLGISHNITERMHTAEEKRRSQETADRLADEMSIIAKIGQVIGSSLDINEVYESFALQAKKLVFFDRLSVNLYNPDASTFTVAYVSGSDIPGRRPGVTVPLAGTISEAILRKRTGLLINTASVEEATGRFPHITNIATIRAGMRSLISVPLISKGEVIGILHFRSKKLNAYTERDLSMAERVGMQIAGAIANGHLYSGLKQAEEELKAHQMQLEKVVKERTEDLEIKNITLQELNTTLKVLLKQRDDDKKDMEERFVTNIRNLILPFVEQMKKGRFDVGQQLCLDIIETHLHNIATPLLKNMRQFNLTPKEIKVAALVRNGRTTKEIAEILNVATGSIDIHRNNIRKKLGLNSRKANLQSHLETLGQ
jgi:PAS domain S-box-containing protein